MSVLPFRLLNSAAELGHRLAVGDVIHPRCAIGGSVVESSQQVVCPIAQVEYAFVARTVAKKREAQRSLHISIHRFAPSESGATARNKQESRFEEVDIGALLMIIYMKDVESMCHDIRGSESFYLLLDTYRKERVPLMELFRQGDGPAFVRTTTQQRIPTLKVKSNTRCALFVC